jgi:pyocin large subunit-like protein
MAEGYPMLRRIALIVALTAATIFGWACPETPPPTPNSPQRAAHREHASIGFASHEKYVQHFRKHGKEFGSIGMEEYLRLAQELRDRPADKDVLEFRRHDGVTTRFDRKSGAFIAFNPDRTIRTLFRPNDGEAYFHRQSKRQPRDQ